MDFVREKVPLKEDDENCEIEGGGSEDGIGNDSKKEKKISIEAFMKHFIHTTMKDSKSSNTLIVQINSISTYLEELTLDIDGQLTYLEEQIDRFHKDFNDGIELLRGQHEEMMKFLKAQFPPHDPT